MTSICILQEETAKSARLKWRQPIRTHRKAHKMTNTANSAALPLCLSSLWSREQGHGKRSRTGTSGNGKRTRCSNSGETAGRGREGVVEQHMEKNKCKRCVNKWWRGRRGRGKYEEFSISHSVTINWTAVTWLLAFLELPVGRPSGPSICLSKC